MITGIVLAGGRSTRMGQDKASLVFGDETLLARSIRLVGSVADEVLVVARVSQGGSDPFLGLPVPVVFDPIEDLGPLAGIAAGLEASRTELNLIVACDMPLVNPAVLRRLLDLREEADICLAVIDGHASPLCAVYRRGVAITAQAMLDSGERRVMTLLDRVQTKRVDAAVFRDIDPNLDTFVSCNTPDELQEAARALARRAAL
jgi:molybdopterin-guanine dinucleotide biosynthesis protein A